MVENVSNNMSKVKNIEVQPITTCSYKKKSVLHPLPLRTDSLFKSSFFHTMEVSLKLAHF